MAAPELAAIDRLAAVVQRARGLVGQPRSGARKFLFEQFEPFFFELTAVHRVVLGLFDEALALMESPASAAETARRELDRRCAACAPAQEQVRALTRELKQAAEEGGAGRDPFTELIRKINWYFHLGVGGIRESRFLMSGRTSLFEVLGNWQGAGDAAALEDVRRLRKNLVSQWATLCTSYTRVKLAFLKAAS
jgi:hypothetical protein